MKLKNFQCHLCNTEIDQFRAFDLFLDNISITYQEEFSKEIYTSKKFILIGIWEGKISYYIHPEVPEEIKNLMLDELDRLCTAAQCLSATVI